MISHIFIDNHSIFDVDQLDAAGFLGSVYGLANTLHVKTRSGFIRKELLFDVGDCHDPFLLEESGRILRGYGFIARADIFAVEQPDGTQHVVVDTQDEWTTRVDVGVSFEEGPQIERVSLTEENLAGYGILGGVFYRQRRERRDLGATLEFPWLFGSRTDVAVSGGRTRDGTFFEETVAYPFVGEVGRFAVRQTFRRRDELFPYSVDGSGDPYTHVLMPYLDEHVEVSLAARLGEPGNLTLFGAGISRETLDVGGFPGSLEIARGNDFGNTQPAPPEVAGRITEQANSASTTRLNLFVGQRNLHFDRVRGLDPLDGIQDIQLGTDLGVTLGRSVDVLSATGLDAHDDLVARFRFFAGHDPGTSYIFLKAGLEGRKVFSGALDGEGWRDVIGELDLYGYLRSRKTPGHTFVARASASGGWSLSTPFQLTLGGREAVRGLPEEAYPGAQRLLITLEDRIFVRWPAPDLLNLGFSVFADAGRVWAGGAPYGRDVRWKGAVGAGLRIGLPAGTRGVARLDLAVPLGARPHWGPVFRITLFEPLGLPRGFADAQLIRSRRVTVGPDYFTAVRR